MEFLRSSGHGERAGGADNGTGKRRSEMEGQEKKSRSAKKSKKCMEATLSVEMSMATEGGVICNNLYIGGTNTPAQFRFLSRDGILLTH